MKLENSKKRLIVIVGVCAAVLLAGTGIFYALSGGTFDITRLVNSNVEGETRPTEKPKPKTEKVAYLRQGAYLDFWWKDPVTGDANISSDIWAAKQASHNNYTPVWVWYKDGVRIRLLTDEEIKTLCT